MLSPDDILDSQGEILADERPSSLDESIVEGKIDAAKYIAFLQKEDDLDEIEADEMIRALYKVTDQEQAAKETPRVQKKRKSRTVKSIKRYEPGISREMIGTTD